jgi:SAM-dependent methyltransferase
MGRPPKSSSPSKNRPSQSVFLNEWHIYRKMVDNNYLHHREAYSTLREYVVQNRDAPFSFLDVACGDASATSTALEGTNVSTYYGVDISKAALARAEGELRKLNCRISLECRDFADVLSHWSSKVDIVWIGISLHHLLYAAKLEVMRDIKRIMANDGALLIYEPTGLDGEDRNDWIERYERQRRSWIKYTPAESEAMGAHTRASDFPETRSAWQELGRLAGFETTQELYAAPTNLLRLFAFR